VTATAWAVTIGLIVALLTLDLAIGALRPHAVGFREATAWSLFYIAVAVVFDLVVGWIAGREFCVQLLRSRRGPCSSTRQALRPSGAARAASRRLTGEGNVSSVQYTPNHAPCTRYLASPKRALGTTTRSPGHQGVTGPTPTNLLKQSQPPEIRRRLCSTAGQLAGMAGNVEFDLHRPDKAQALYGVARAAAEQADDPAVLCCV